MNLIKNLLKKTLSRRKDLGSPIDHRDITDEERKIIDFVKVYTMTSHERLLSLIRAIYYLEQHSIVGDFVECGVWKGGSVMAMIKVLQSLGKEDRVVWLFDTFQGMTEPKDIDSKYDNAKAEMLLNMDSARQSNVWAVSSLDEVVTNVSSIGYSSSKLKFVEGPVETTLTNIDINEIALLRLDTDWYESTKIELEILFPKLVKGGILIIDDYGHWQGCKKAVDEYFASMDNPVFLHRIDYTGRLFVKYW